MQAGGRSPFEHLSSTALLLQKRGGCLGAGSSRCWQRGRTGCNVCSVQSQQLFVVQSAINSRGPVAGEGFSHFIPKTQGMQSPPPSVPTAEQAQPFSAKAQGACSLPQPPPHPRPVPSGGDRQMPCACITQLLSTCQQVTQALCPAPRSRHTL